MRRRLLIVLAAALAVVLLAAGGLWGWRHVRTAQAQEAACEAASEQRVGHDAARAELEGGQPPTVTVIGDSYSEALDIPAEHLDQTFPYLVGEQLGMAVHVDGAAGTGYVNPGPCEGEDDSFPERVDDDLASEVVILQGGLNDGGDLDTLAERARDIFEEIQATNPAAEVYALGPVAVPAFDRADVAAIDNTLRQAAEDDGVTYVSLLDLDLDVISDRIHPSLRGHEQIAEAVTAALR